MSPDQHAVIGGHGGKTAHPLKNPCLCCHFMKSQEKMNTLPLQNYVLHTMCLMWALLKSSKRNVFKASITMLLKTFLFCTAVVGLDGYSAGFLRGVPHHCYTLKRLRTKC